MSVNDSMEFLAEAYEGLDFAAGRLLVPGSLPQPEDSGDWLSVGDWLMLAQRMGADRMFFVGDEPIVVFKSLAAADEAEIVAAYRRAWCLAGPRCLFLSLPGELRVYGLSAPPPSDSLAGAQVEPLHVVRSAVRVTEELAAFTRARFESGEALANQDLQLRTGRADQQLLADIRAAAERLVTQGMSISGAHTLVERLILIRYLEDRKVIDASYFREVAVRDAEWVQIIDAVHPDEYNFGADSAFLKCLSSRDFTYAIFDRLQRDFNGDLFSLTQGEAAEVEQSHLILAQRMLSGDGVDDMRHGLFLWAYDFSIIPITLISNMYEMFYQLELAGNSNSSGTHYTPADLVRFVLSRTLSAERLAQKPRVVDPSCGSGVFLVEAFGYMVRHAAVQKGAALTPSELREILTTRIAGVDINEGAVRLAAFSLYVALLNYQSPQDIRQAGPLPGLIHKDGAELPGSLVVADAFAPDQQTNVGEVAAISGTLPWKRNSFDVVVGNPPWTEPRKKTTNERAAKETYESWLTNEHLVVGERNPSQAFLWRALTLVKPDGIASLLVGATAFLLARGKSREFQREWLNKAQVRNVVNFTDVRSLFFSDAIAPFMLVTFARRDDDDDPSNVVEYDSARFTGLLDQSYSMAFARLDHRLVRQMDLQAKPYLWKAYGWGNQHDAALLARLDVEDTFEEVLVPQKVAKGYGYQRGPKEPSTAVKSLRSLKEFTPWGPLADQQWEEPPAGVKRDPSDQLYRGQRLVIRQGAVPGFGTYARLEQEDFAFRHVVFSLPLPKVPKWQAEVGLGVLLSRLGRYRVFMLSGSWGLWHDCIYVDDALRLPIRLPGYRDPRVQRLVKAVRLLPKAEMNAHQTIRFTGETTVSAEDVLSEIDESVFELFEFTNAERALVDDFHDYTLPLSRKKTNQSALQGLSTAAKTQGQDGQAPLRSRVLNDYVQAFIENWSPRPNDAPRLSWQLIGDTNSPALMVMFSNSESASTAGSSIAVDDGRNEWNELLRRFARSVGSLPDSKRLASEGVVRAVTSSQIIIVKRNESRLWTRSKAREDAEATLLQALRLAS